MKRIHKKVRVVHNVDQYQFDVETRKWFIWEFDSTYCYWHGDGPTHHRPFSLEKAKSLAISRAESLAKKEIILEL